MIKLADPSDFKSSDIPTDPGVYLYRDEAGEIIYVGKAKSLRSRVKSYFSSNDHPAKDAAAGVAYSPDRLGYRQHRS